MRRAEVQQHRREQPPVARRVVLRVDALQGAVGEPEERDPEQDGGEERLEADGVRHWALAPSPIYSGHLLPVLCMNGQYHVKAAKSIDSRAEYL